MTRPPFPSASARTPHTGPAWETVLAPGRSLYHTPFSGARSEELRDLGHRVSVTTANSGRLNSRKPLNGVVLLPSPRETNIALSPRV